MAVEIEPELEPDLMVRLEAVERLDWAQLEPDPVALTEQSYPFGLLDCFSHAARLGNQDP